MPHHFETNLASEHRMLPLEARADLEVLNSGDQNSSVVIRDPLTLEIYQLSSTEYFLWQEMRGRRSLSDLKQALERRFAPHTVTTIQVHQALDGMLREGLLMSTARGQAQELLARAGEHRRQERWQRWLGLLSFRVAHWNSTNFVNGAYRSLRWLFTRWVGAAALVAVLYAAWILLAHSTKLFDSFPAFTELAKPRYWPAWLVTVACVKFLHELGHALTCQHFGGRCHDMGIMLLAGFPCFYCDVTDAWRQKNKWRRIAISFAGIVVELVIAATAVIVAWHAQPGMLRNWLLAVALLCSIQTLVVNANPLMRYDGYYVLADLLAIPNLASRSRGLWQRRLRAWLLGQPTSPDPVVSSAQQRRIVAYAFASRIYGWVVLIAIFAFLLNLARSWQLESFVYLLAAITLLGMLLPTLQMLWQFSANPLQQARLKYARVAVLAAGLIGVAAAILFFPLKHTVEGALALIPNGAANLYATEAGRMVQLKTPGTVVAPGEVVARLVNPELDLRYERAVGDLAVKESRVQQLETLRALQPRLASELPSATAELQQAERVVARLAAERERLVLKSPVAGTILVPPAAADETRGELPTWQRTLVEEANTGAWVETGTHVCSIGKPESLKALVAIHERDVEQVERGDPVKICLAADPGQIFSGTVVQVASRADDTEEKAATERTHLVEVDLDTAPTLALSGARGWAKIAAQRTTLWRLANDYLDRRLRLPW